ncbi:4-diphosphocytidyl-2-C-methyl-D-erythritol kinase [Prochlorococcus marinus str. MIT 9302]|uniref:4-diphosphocytidyl-2-C-methyl-D-erythritol kinase n=1 Tax=Prochlorococcus marinus str. MIT 9302 TaxID=74545 RepID=A0A0A2ADK0_PROMR|nr:4-(cytidine 5'-diphospho)-2-C-methyl-D-erythritol kinase [Prochlorococcus marinus]KGF98554.1 4-diphosphocytidyl-2-C-methyl-D-erythritol kinase [Prochlorococcus marinus str. MIT 9302]
MQDLAKTKIIIKSPAKINLHLEVIGKREDGFHELAMIMQNIDLSDYLEFQINNEGLIKLESDCNNLSLASDNLIVKSANLLRKKLNIDLGANIFLRKNIPIGAGLAGGSSNAAATLIGLNKLWDLNLDQKTLCSLASMLGSDIPFFINGGIQLCFGRGEILEKLDSNFEYGVLLLKNPKVSVSTAETYKKYSNKFCDQYLTNREKIENIRKNLRDNGLKNLSFDNKHLTIKNDLQLVVENDNDSVKQSLYLLSKLKNCLTSSMSGSGPTCFALFKDIETAKKELSANYKLFKDKGYDAWVCTFLEMGIAFM